MVILNVVIFLLGIVCLRVNPPPPLSKVFTNS